MRLIGQDAIPVLELDIGQAHAACHAGVVDQAVNAAVVLGDELAQRLPGRGIGDIERMGADAPGPGGPVCPAWDQPRAGARRAGRRRSRRALGGESRRLGLALATGGPGDDDHLVLYAATHSVTKPAVDTQRLAGHGCGGVRGQVAHGAGDVGRTQFAVERLLRADRRKGLLGDVGCVAGVRVSPGATALTVMLRAPHSTARARVMPSSAPFEVM